jgi:hypothetical protein
MCSSCTGYGNFLVLTARDWYFRLQLMDKENQLPSRYLPTSFTARTARKQP